MAVTLTGTLAEYNMNSLIMGIALSFVTVFSSLTVSLLKDQTSKH